jgi:hypothetical protein
MWLVILWAQKNEKCLIKDTAELSEFLKIHHNVAVEWINIWTPTLIDPLDNSPKHKDYVPLVPLSHSEPDDIA